MKTKITKKEYLLAQSIVKEYEAALIAAKERKVAKIRKALEAFFKANKVSKKIVKEFSLNLDPIKNSIDIIPIDPHFSEDYSDKWADKEIEKIGEKYNMQLSWIYTVQGK